jgi:glyoxylase-like metal-dependent hydrolase (beta-lactamase superfamily II)
MSETETGGQETTDSIARIECSVDWTPGHVATYLIDAGEPILVDAGMVGERAQEELESGLAEHGYALADVEHLIVTHPHTDHIGQVNAVLAANEPTVYAPSTVEARFERDPDDLEATVRQNAAAAGLPEQPRERAVEMSVDSLERDSDLLSVDTVDHWIERGATIEVGPVTMTAIHAPGHQADHLCYEADVDGERVLLSGDMAISAFRSVALHTGFDHGYEDAIDAYYTALDRLGGRPIDRVFPGHGPVHGDFAATIEAHRESLDELLDRTQAVLDDERPKSVMDVALERSGAKNIEYLLIETAGALAKLARDGEAAVTTDDEGVHQYTPA